jgi:hypothetical protein
MVYPTLNEINQASHYELGKWMRFLQSPGLCAAGEKDFDNVMNREKKLLDRIIERFSEMGGWNPSLSKMVGW